MEEEKEVRGGRDNILGVDLGRVRVVEVIPGIGGQNQNTGACDYTPQHSCAPIMRVNITRVYGSKKSESLKVSVVPLPSLRKQALRRIVATA